MVKDMLSVTKNIHAMRDPTRGGLATTLNELAKSSNVGVHIEQQEIPVREDVNSACEILGIDPLYVANEGKLVAVVPADAAEDMLAAMHKNEFGKDARIIGEVTKEHEGMVIMRNTLGVDRIIDIPLGEQLPRIC